MKICISTQGDSLDAAVEARFGRCMKFVFVDTESGEHEIKDNPSQNAMGGAGIQAAQFVADSGAKAVLTGNVGPNAFETLTAANISICTGVSGTISEVVEKFKNGEYKATAGPSVDSHFGMA